MTVKRAAQSLKAQFYETILSRITHMQYNAGDILTEKLLAEEFNVSKSPIREALLDLCSEGLLRNIPRYGYEITAITNEEVAEMNEFRIALECSFLGRRYRLIDDEAISRLENIKRETDTITCNEVINHWNRNSAFHLTLFSCYKNKYAERCLKATLRRLGIAYVRNYWGGLHSTKAEIRPLVHARIIASLKEGKAEEAVRELEEDIRNFNVIEEY